MSTSSYVRLADGHIGLRRLREGAGISVLCFPHAGGQSLAFRELAAQLTGDISVYAVDPPGHGWAPGPPLESIAALVAAYREHLPPALLGGALLGHSMGGYVALELAATGPAPRAVIVGATRPPHRRGEYAALSRLDDAALQQTLDEGNGGASGTPAALFDHFRAVIRADLRAFDDYSAPDRPIDTPLLAVGGLDDALCRAEHVFDWHIYADRCLVDFVGGGHLFMQSQAQAYAARIQRFLGALAGLPRRSDPL